MEKGAGVGHAHNGTMSMLIELGVPGFAVALGLMLWMFACILRNPAVSSHVRGFYFTYFFTIFGRSLSENYTPLDLGNYFNYIFIIFSGYLFLNLKFQNKPVMAPAYRGMMAMRPGLRPALTRRPVGTR
jgi:O-antigen ligase